MLTALATAEQNAADAAVRKILNTNTKLEKHPSGASVVVRGVSMAPSKRSGVVNVCPDATAACIAACCLWFAGRTVSAGVRAAAIARTVLWFLWPERFLARLHAEIVGAAALASVDGARLFVRLNAASDIAWPLDFIASLPCTCYDYTKNVGRALANARGEHPENYSVSLSVHEHSRFDDIAAMVADGGNVVVVFDSVYSPGGSAPRFGTLPDRVAFTSPDGRRVVVRTVDGDLSDIRSPEFDGSAVAVCLRLKGTNASKATAIKAGFARPWSLGTRAHSTVGGYPPARGTAVVRLA